MKKVITMLLILSLALGLVACGSNNTAANNGAGNNASTNASGDAGDTGAETNDIKIGVAIASFNSTALQALGEAFETTAAELGVECVLSNADNDLERQIDQVQDMVMQGCDAIIVNGVDADGIAPVVEDARSQGVKVLAVDRLVNADVDYCLVTDNYAAGVGGAEYFIEVANGEEVEVLLLTSTPSNTAIRDRQTGFKDTLLKHPNMKIVAEPFCEVSTELAYNAIIDGFKAHPNIRFIFAAGDAFLPAMQAALIELDMQKPIDDPDHVYMTTTDGEKYALESVANGTHDHVACQLFTDMAVKCMEVAVDMCKGIDPETTHEEYPILNYTRETMDSIPVEKLWGLR